MTNATRTPRVCGCTRTAIAAKLSHVRYVYTCFVCRVVQLVFLQIFVEVYVSDQSQKIIPPAKFSISEMRKSIQTEELAAGSHEALSEV